jgi:adenylate cyclase class 2
MIEVEVKARCTPKTQDKIIAMGAQLVGVENHFDLYFNSPYRNFAKSDEALRIRVKESGVYLAYKGPKLDEETKSREEMTVIVSDAEMMGNILKALGFIKSGVVRKRRTKYALGSAILAYDEVENLGTFLEVELSGDDDWSLQKENALDIMNRLGLQESIRKSYLEMLIERA